VGAKRVLQGSYCGRTLYLVPVRQSLGKKCGCLFTGGGKKQEDAYTALYGRVEARRGGSGTVYVEKVLMTGGLRCAKTGRGAFGEGKEKNKEL